MPGARSRAGLRCGKCSCGHGPAGEGGMHAGAPLYPLTRSSASTSSTPRYFCSEWRAASFLPRIYRAGKRGELGGIRA